MTGEGPPASQWQLRVPGRGLSCRPTTSTFLRAEVNRSGFSGHLSGWPGSPGRSLRAKQSPFCPRRPCGCLALRYDRLCGPGPLGSEGASVSRWAQPWCLLNEKLEEEVSAYLASLPAERREAQEPTC